PIEKGLVRVEPAQITVRLNVSAPATKTLHHVPIHVTGLAEHLQLEWVQPEDGTLDLVLMGASETLDRLTASDVRVILDVSQQSAGEHSGTVVVELPPSVQLRGERAVVRYELRTVDVPAGVPEDRISDGEVRDGGATNGKTQDEPLR